MQIIMDYLPVTPTEVPVKKTFSIGSVTYKFEFKYNDRFDYYMCYIYDINDNLLYSSKLIYFNSLIHALVNGLNIPYSIIPLNINQIFSNSILDTLVNSENLDSRVRLYIDNPVVS